MTIPAVSPLLSAGSNYLTLAAFTLNTQACDSQRHNILRSKVLIDTPSPITHHPFCFLHLTSWSPRYSTHNTPHSGVPSHKSARASGAFYWETMPSRVGTQTRRPQKSPIMIPRRTNLVAHILQEIPQCAPRAQLLPTSRAFHVLQQGAHEGECGHASWALKLFRGHCLAVAVRVPTLSCVGSDSVAVDLRLARSCFEV